MNGCRVCGAPVRVAQDGVVLRAGRFTLTLCSAHARLAHATVTIMGRAAVRGLGQVLEAEHPATARALRSAGALSEAIGAQYQSTEPEVIDAPRRVEVVQPRRRSAAYDDVIEGEIIEVKP